MNVLHLTSWLSAKGGGIPPVVFSLARESRQGGIGTVVAGLENGLLVDSTYNDSEVVAGKISGPASFGYSSELRSRVFSRVPSPAMVHVHGLWMYPGVLGRQFSERLGTPRIISPHGMLEPWALNNSRWKKRLAAIAFENRNLRSASCLHALCETEAKNFRSYGLTNPIAVVPNGIDPRDFQNLPPRELVERRFPTLKEKRLVLFLSRIHPKKGLPHLLKAWAHIQKSEVRGRMSDWILLIAGPDELSHEAEMKQLATELGIEREVVFTGALHGAEKLAVLAGADFFVLPSFSEGFSMAVLEAAACAVPVMLTRECNFPELVSAGGAIEISPTAESCEAGLRRLLSLSEAERKEMGQRGKRLVEQSYIWSAIAGQMLALYRWLLGQNERPSCVTLD